MEGTLELPSLGRKMCLGTLYDCRSHQIISPGVTLWDQGTISHQKEVSERKSHKATRVSSHSFNEKIKVLEVDDSLKASILADLVQPVGAAKFLGDQLPVEGTSRLSVHSKATSAIEQLPLNQLASCKIQNLEMITEGKATHVVVGVMYGANTFFVFDKSCGEETKVDCMKSLIPLVGAFSSVPDEGESSKFDPKHVDDVEYKVHSDLDVEGNYLDYKAASKILKGIPDMLKENAVPVKFFLYPLHKIDSRAAWVCKVVSDGLLLQAQDFLDGLEHCSARASEMAADPLCVDFPQFAEKLAFFKRMLSEYKMDFQKEFARVLPLIQGGSDGESVLKEMLQNAATVSPFKFTELDAWLKSKRKELSAVRLYVNILPAEREIVKSQESLDDILMDPSIDNVVCLTFRLAGKEEGYLRSLSQYLATRKESNYSFHQWCDDDFLKLFRPKAKLFADFYKSNLQSTDTKFIVTGFAVSTPTGDDSARVGGTVLLYEQGTLAQEDFEPPSKPGKPRCDVIDHNTIDVTWSPPEHGEDSVKRYIVKFKRFRKKKQSGGITGEVFTEKGDTCYSFKNLEPNEALEFQITAVCSVGVSPDSDSSDRVTTLPASPPGKPEAHPASASSIALEWEHPDQSGKQVTIQSYVIKYGKSVNGAVPSWQPEVDTGSPEAKYTIRKLDTNVSYMFQVYAVYDSGVTSLSSASSNVCATMPVSQPGKPELGHPTASSVDMKWTGPAKIGPGVELKEYFIEYTEVEEQQGPSGEWKWKQRLTNCLNDDHKLSDLKPKTTYICRVVLVCEDGFMTQSEVSAPFTTLPAGPPTDEAAEQISATDIEVTWSKPALASQQTPIKHYRVEYQVVIDDNCVDKEIYTNDNSCTCTISDAIPETKFKIGVTAVCGEEEELGEKSKVISFTTKKLPKHEIRIHAKILTKGNQRNGTPEILKLPLEELCRRPHGQSFSFGEPPKMQGEEHKVIMVVGVTGSGKSTLINAMVNNVLDVERKDDFRFKVVDVNEAKGSSQAHSQTQVLTSYTIYRNNYLRLPYTLTIIDTPGFGDTRGIERDKGIMDHIREFFLDSEAHGIDHIDAIGFVVQASQARLTQTQKYVFDSILSVFGKDMAGNILLMVTFADQNDPPVLAAVEEANIPHNGGAFKFNNSALFSGQDKNCKGCKTKAGKEDMVDLFWDMGKTNMEDFLLEIQSLESRSLVLTKEVLGERKHLEVAVQGLQPQINTGICKLEELQKEHQMLEQHERDIEANKDFKFELEVPRSRMVDISDSGKFITNCSKCHYTCHYPCSYADDKEKANCAAMRNGECTVCPGKCVWNVHFNQSYKFEYYTEKEERTYEEIEARYKDASGKKMTVEQVIEKQVEEVQEVRTFVYKLVSDMRKSIMRLEEIALKPNPLSTPEYIDVLIESEKRSHRPGWKSKVEALQGLRQGAEIMSKVKDENYDPFQNFKTMFQPAGKDKKPHWLMRVWTSLTSPSANAPQK